MNRRNVARRQTLPASFHRVSTTATPTDLGDVRCHAGVGCEVHGAESGPFVVSRAESNVDGLPFLPRILRA